ncbi:MAG TPA: TetR family transcriptional regulator, partial [Acidimicrobiales bacterium]
MVTRPRRSEALSRDRIVDAAVELLDAAGPAGLTFRVLTERLATGPGAIYWHVANKGELLAAATDAVVAAALAAGPTGSSPEDRIRALALGLFDAVDEHPWVAAQLSDSSWQATTPRILEAVGREVRALNVPEGSWFTVASV